MERANERLMAAAPDLLAALTEASGWLSNWNVPIADDEAWRTEAHRNPDDRGRIKVVRAAIAKAEGAVMSDHQRAERRPDPHIRADVCPAGLAAPWLRRDGAAGAGMGRHRLRRQRRRGWAPDDLGCDMSFASVEQLRKIQDRALAAEDDCERLRERIAELEQLIERAKSGGSVPYGWYAAAVEDSQTATARIAELERERDEAIDAHSRERAAHEQTLQGLLRASAAEALSAAAVEREKKLTTALQSIAANTCCDRCQEAALVARAALSSPAPGNGAADQSKGHTDENQRLQPRIDFRG
jgi:hypothetical protein